MKITIPSKETEVCDRCRREGYLQSCIVCGDKFCLTCEGIICGCVHETDVCKKCENEPAVLAVVKKYVPRFMRVVKARDAEFETAGRLVKKTRCAEQSKKRADRQREEGDEG